MRGWADASDVASNPLQKCSLLSLLRHILPPLCWNAAARTNSFWLFQPPGLLCMCRWEISAFFTLSPSQRCERVCSEGTGCPVCFGLGGGAGEWRVSGSGGVCRKMWFSLMFPLILKPGSGMEIIYTTVNMIIFPYNSGWISLKMTFVFK